MYSASASMKRDRSGRLPVGEDGNVPLGFATLSHSNLKSWAQVRNAEGHNTRAKETPNARAGAPAPIELIEELDGPYIERVKDVLVKHEVPIKIRKGGTIACEDIFGASPEYWGRDGDWTLKPVDEIRNDPVVVAAVALARRKHGPRLVSCSLHLDEASPHIHVISVPLVQRAHSKRGRKPKDIPRDPDGKPLAYNRPLVTKWSLDVSSMRGLSSQLEKNHDEWAEVCKPMGLMRGAKGSEMTEEQRRARRNRQTGRSSLAEAEAREERERLWDNVELAHEQAQEYKKQTKATKEATDAELLQAKEERQAAASASARASAQEIENQRVRDQLAKEENELAERKKRFDKKTAELDSAAKMHEDQIRLIGRTLDLTDPVVLYEDEGKLHIRRHDEQDLNAAKGSWDWLVGGIEALTKRLTQLRNREADAEKVHQARERLLRDEERHRVQIGIMAKALDPNVARHLEFDDTGNHVAGLNAEESDALATGSSWFKTSLKTVLAGMRRLAERSTALDQKLAAVVRREDAAAEREAIVTVQEMDLRRDENIFNNAAPVLKRYAQLGVEFFEAWRKVPDEERSPSVQNALKAAEGLTMEDMPPGFLLPGQGGHSRG